MKPMEVKEREKPKATATPSVLDRAFEFDFTQLPAFAVLAAVYILSRLPWLNQGYGTDPDAWRVALSAEYLLDTGEYLPSRLPGFPLHELVTLPLVRAGWVWTNLSTVLISFAGVYLFAQICKELAVPNKGALTLAFAFTPLLWINSMTTMDYMWALTFILACYFSLIRRRFIMAGVCLGLALGFRLTSLWAAPAFLVWLWRERELRRVAPFLAATGIIAIVTYLPVFARYGLGMFNFYDAKVGFLSFLRLMGKETLGIVGALAVIAGLLLSLPRLVRLPSDIVREPHVALWVSAVLVFFVSFTRLPHEIAYLIPVFPFGFLLLSRYSQRGVLAFVAIAVILAGFLDVTSPGDEINRQTFTNAEIGKGMVLSNGDTMENQREFAEELAGKPVHEHSLVLSGFIYPQLVMRYKNRLDIGILERDYDAISMLSDRGAAVDREKDIHYAWLIGWEKFQEFRAEGYNLYFVRDAGISNASVFGFRPAYFGATKLSMEQETASGEGAAKTDR